MVLGILCFTGEGDGGPDNEARGPSSFHSSKPGSEHPPHTCPACTNCLPSLQGAYQGQWGEQSWASWGVLGQVGVFAWGPGLYVSLYSWSSVWPLRGHPPAGSFQMKARASLPPSPSLPGLGLSPLSEGEDRSTGWALPFTQNWWVESLFPLWVSVMGPGWEAVGCGPWHNGERRTARLG